MSVQNYKTLVYSFGDWPRGTVLPEFAVLWAYGPDATTADEKRAQIAEMVGREMIAPTRDSVAKETVERLKSLTASRKAKAVAPDTAAAEAAQTEIADLKARLAACEAAGEALALQAGQSAARADELLREIANYVETNAGLTRACDEHQARIEALEKQLAESQRGEADLKLKVAELTAELESATAPAPKKK